MEVMVHSSTNKPRITLDRKVFPADGNGPGFIRHMITVEAGDDTVTLKLFSNAVVEIVDNLASGEEEEAA